MSVMDWEATLDAFEQRLEAQERAYRDGLVEAVPPFEPPAVATAIPAAFVDRATQLVWRCRALEDTLAAALHTAREQLDRVGEAVAGPAAPASPMYFDSRI
jgi:hypothetical protein